MFKYFNESVVFATAIHVVPPFVDCSQPVIVPVYPASFRVPELIPEQIVSLTDKVPASVNGLTAMVVTVDVSLPQPAFPSIDLYCVVTFTWVYANEVVVFTIGVQVIPPFVDDSHFNTGPTEPDKVIDPLLSVSQ